MLVLLPFFRAVLQDCTELVRTNLLAPGSQNCCLFFARNRALHPICRQPMPRGEGMCREIWKKATSHCRLWVTLCLLILHHSGEKGGNHRLAFPGKPPKNRRTQRDGTEMLGGARRSEEAPTAGMGVSADLIPDTSYNVLKTCWTF